MSTKRAGGRGRRGSSTGEKIFFVACMQTYTFWQVPATYVKTI